MSVFHKPFVASKPANELMHYLKSNFQDEFDEARYINFIYNDGVTGENLSHELIKFLISICQIICDNKEEVKRIIDDE